MTYKVLPNALVTSQPNITIADYIPSSEDIDNYHHKMSIPISLSWGPSSEILTS